MGPLVSLLVDLFRKRRFIRETVLPLIQQAEKAYAFTDGAFNNDHRRHLVVNALRARGLSDSEAALLTEAGVRLYKRLQAKAAKRAARKARRMGIVNSDRPATLHRPDLGEPPE